MFSHQDLVVIDAVARRGSFSAAADELNKVPSAISYTVKSIEQKLTVCLFIRLHRKVKLTAAGVYFVEQARLLLKQMDDIKFKTQRVANGWQSSLSIALDKESKSYTWSALMGIRERATAASTRRIW